MKYLFWLSLIVLTIIGITLSYWEFKGVTDDEILSFGTFPSAFNLQPDVNETDDFHPEFEPKQPLGEKDLVKLAHYRETSVKLAEQAAQILPQDPTEAFRLAAASMLLIPSIVAEKVVWKALENPFYVKLAGHQGDVLDAVFSPTGDRIATSSADHTIRIWDPLTATVVQTIDGGPSINLYLAFSPDGQRIAAGGDDLSVKIWEVSAGKLLAELRHHTDRITGLAFSPDGKVIASASKDRSVIITDSQSYQVLRRLTNFTTGVNSVSFSGQGRYMITASDQDGVNLYRSMDGQGFAGTAPIINLKNITGVVRQALISPNGRQIAVIYQDKPAELWRADIYNQGLHAVLGTTVSLKASYSAQGEYLATAQGRTTYIWDTISGKKILSLKGHQEEVLSASYSPNQPEIVTASKDNTARIWRLDSSLIYGTPLAEKLYGHEDQVLDATFSGNGKRLISVARDGVIKQWDTASRKEIRSLRKTVPGTVRVKFTHDDQRFITGSDDGIVRIFDAGTGILLHTLPLHRARVNDIAVFANTDRIVTASADTTAAIWNRSANRVEKVMQNHTDSIIGAAIMPDDERIVTISSDGLLFIWNQDGTDRRIDIHDFYPHHTPMAVFADMVLLVPVQPPKIMKLWKFTERTPAIDLPESGAEIVHLCASANGDYIAAAFYDRSIQVYWTVTGELVRAYKASAAEITRLAFSPDDRYIAGASKDHRIHLWPAHVSMMFDMIFQHKTRGHIPQLRIEN